MKVVEARCPGWKVQGRTGAGGWVWAEHPVIGRARGEDMTDLLDEIIRQTSRYDEAGYAAEVAEREERQREWDRPRLVPPPG